MSQNLSELRGKIIELRRVKLSDEQIAEKLGVSILLIKKVFSGRSSAKLGNIEKKEILRLFSEGYTIRRISQLIDRNNISVSKVLKEYIGDRPKKFRMFIENEDAIVEQIGKTHLKNIAAKYKSSYSNLRLWLAANNILRNKKTSVRNLYSNTLEHLRSGVTPEDVAEAGGPTMFNLLSFARSEGTEEDVKMIEGFRKRAKAPKRRWTSQEVDTLIEMKGRGASLTEISAVLGRSVAAINIKQHQV